MNWKSLYYFVLVGVVTGVGCGDRGAEVKAALEGIAPGDRVTVVLETELGLSLSNAAGEEVHWEIHEISGTVSEMDEERLTVAVDIADLAVGMSGVLPSEGNRLAVEYRRGSDGSMMLVMSINKPDIYEPGIDITLPIDVLAEVQVRNGSE